MKIYVGEFGNIVYDPTGIEKELLNQMVEVDSIPTLEPKQDYHVVIKANKSENRVWAEYVKNEKTIEQYQQEAIDKTMTELIEGGLI